MPFQDRRDAGRQLARILAQQDLGDDVLVLGLARGGLPVAHEVATALDAPLDVMVARKLGAPGNPEYGIGAIAPDALVVDDAITRSLRLSQQEIDDVIARERLEMERRILQYRGTNDPPRVAQRTVILVDDGIATGGTARAAIRALRKWRAGRIVLAAPVGAPDSVASLREEADDVVCVETPDDFRAVGLWYDDFAQTSDREVQRILQASRVPIERAILIPAGDAQLHADLTVPHGALGLVVFAHGSGSGRMSPRNRQVARMLNDAGLATLLLDLLSVDEERVDAVTREFRFNIDLLSRRLCDAIDWAATDEDTRALGIGLYGSSTGGAAALVAASMRPNETRAVVSRGGRPDLAGDALAQVCAPVLLIVGGRDHDVLALNRDAAARLRSETTLEVVEGATHLFEEPGALETVAELTAARFRERLPPEPAQDKEALRRGAKR